MLSNSDEAQTAAFKSYTRWLSEARDKQIAPAGNWAIWLILAGRGWGKTKTGAEDIVSYAMRHPNSICAVVAPTLGDLRRTCIEGPSGILSTLPEECLENKQNSPYNSRTAEIKLWNGSKIMGFSANEPDRMRGPQYHRAWCDELAAWRYEEAFDQLQFGLRLGQQPQMVITTTPRNTPLVRKLMDRTENDVHLTSGSTFENEKNLAESALQTFRERYEGTRLGRQELYAEVLTDIEGALWTYGRIEEARVTKEQVPEMKRIVVSVDPAVTANEHSDETGIIVAGLGEDNKYYVLEDKSGKFSADKWARQAIDCFYIYKADRIVCEVNQGGDLVTKIIRDIDQGVPLKSVNATRGKMVRAEPISALYEQNRVRHVGMFKDLEDEMCTYEGSRANSPDRLDALVWALTELSMNNGQVFWRIS